MTLEFEMQAALQQARTALASGRLAHARLVCEQLLSKRRRDPHATVLLAQIAWKEASYEEAISLLQQHVQRYPGDSLSRLGLGRYLSDQGRYKEAIRHLDRIVRKDRSLLDAREAIAEAHERAGNRSKAKEYLEPIVQSGKATPGVARVYAQILLNERRFEEAATYALRHAGNESADDFNCRQLYHIAGQALEKLDRIDEAFDAYRHANARYKEVYDPEQERKEIDAIIQAYSSKAMARLPRASAHGSKQPNMIFIVGRPRSGTTLIERILGGSPLVHSAGEVPALVRVVHRMSLSIGSTLEHPACITDLDQTDVDRLSEQYFEQLPRRAHSATHVTDKHLYTWRFLGAVGLLIPNARIIDVRRDPVDNCFSCYCSALGDRFPFSRKLEHLGHAHREYERLMNHWHCVLNVPMLKVRYEDVVDDLEQRSCELLQFCDLPWDENVLRFHEDKTQRGRTSAAPTLSYDQVRRPIYRSSVGRAERFGKHLDPLRDALQGKSGQ